MAAAPASMWGPLLRSGKLAKQEPAPQEPDQAVGIPQRKGDGEPDFADGEDSQSVRHGPQRAGQDSPDDQVRSFTNVSEHVAGSLENHGDCPPGYKDSRDHSQRNHEGREPGVHQFGGGFGEAEPCSGGGSRRQRLAYAATPAAPPHAPGNGDQGRTIPIARTPAGSQKCKSVRIARASERFGDVLMAGPLLLRRSGVLLICPRRRRT